MARPNYQREKRLKDLARQQKQEDKRARRHQKDGQTEPEPTAPAPVEETDPAPEA
ncbi:hypothetical protein [Mesoterricola sediminis]|uniref:Uncharacterized protein n=1 Tax=Mesoterricola sediminis TaxID=2927980 RepID=A0AA48GTE2_9BACT|nr:hypothetical protein [Mesoterricola sediminis]BDU77379.1 hypothetical protein METESE_23370 [Mesoterricola sediminis]